MNRVGEIKSWVREINLTMLSTEHKVGFDVRKRKSKKFQILMPNRKLIKYVTKIGGVLTGSRALRCYTLNGKEMLDRKMIDWDFIVTKEMAFKICDHFGIQYDLVSKVISVQKQRWWAHPDYSDSYRVGPVDVQLIIHDELPEFNEKDGVRISKFGYIISEKARMIDSIGGDKHLDDLNQMIIKFNCL